MAFNVGATNDSPENVTSGLSLNQSEDEDQLLRAINDQKANLLLPAILVTVCLMILGLVGNPLAIYIYGWRWQPSSTKVFLFSLAVIDLMNCLITIPTEITIMSNFYNFHSDGLCKVSRFTTYVMNNATSAIFLAIAVDRYIRICHPYRSAMSARRAKIACGIGLMIGLTVSWPALFIYGRINLKVPGPKRLDPDSPPVYVNAFMCIVHADMSQYSLAFFVYLCVAVFLCTLILVVFYTLIGRAILKRKRLSRMRKETTAATLETFGGATPTTAVKNGCVLGSNGVDSSGSGRSKRDKRLTTNSRSTSSSSPRPPPKREKGAVTPEDESQHGCDMQSISFRCKKLRPHRATLTMFCITVVYITSFFPFLIISIIRQHRGPAFYLGLSSKEEVAVSIFIRSYIVNNCTNPIVYGLCNSQFREECRRLWWRLCRRRGSGGGGGPNVAQSNSRQNSFANRSRTLFEPTPRLERKISPEP